MLVMDLSHITGVKGSVFIESCKTVGYMWCIVMGCELRLSTEANAAYLMESWTVSGHKLLGS